MGSSYNPVSSLQTPVSKDYNCIQEHVEQESSEESITNTGITTCLLACIFVVFEIWFMYLKNTYCKDLRND